MGMAYHFDVKVCNYCEKEKSLDQFYKHSGMKDGYLNTCKECKIEYMASRPKDRLKEINKKRNQKPKRQEDKRIRSKAYRQKYPEKKRLYEQEYRKKYPEKYKARNAVHNAIRDGKLTKLPCEVCNSTKNIEAHHDDYYKPLELRWLCHKHHVEHHFEEEEL